MSSPDDPEAGDPQRDRDLGMDRAISRRDFLNGALVAAGAVAATSGLGTTGCAPQQAPPPRGRVGMAGAPPSPDVSPPSRLGLRGHHAGALETAHEMAFERRSDWGEPREPDAEVYDLIVVGAGVSGLAAACFYREAHPAARILLLENHDDFGGHAKRNAFEWQGRTILGYGGSQSLEAPGSYSEVALGLLSKLGVEPQRLADAYDLDFYRRHGLGSAIYFDRATYGVDRVLRTDLIDAAAFVPVARVGTDPLEDVDHMPISAPARAELKRIMSPGPDVLPGHGLFDEPDYLQSITYLEFLTRHLGVSEPEVIALLRDLPSNYMGQGIDTTPAFDAIAFGLPGAGSTSMRRLEGLARRAIPWLVEPYVFHFPDGNASVARLLVQKLVPEALTGPGVEAVLEADLDYAQLDRSAHAVRLRLESTVVRVAHDGAPDRAQQVDVTYVRRGRTERVRARRVVLACWNMVVPHLCPELPAPQREALSSLVKLPLVYTSVLIRSWRAFEKLGIGLAHCPGAWHPFAMLDFPVSMGRYSFSTGPDDPIVVHLAKAVVAPGLPPRAQARAARLELLQTTFETIERGIRTHLGGMLAAGGFDPAEDILAIAANRWAHGYAWGPNPVFDPEYEPGEAPHEIGRQRFGRIVIANSDAGARAYLDEAIDQAWRAVGELEAAG